MLMVATTVRLPPSRVLRAAPKKRLGRTSAAGVTVLLMGRLPCTSVP